MRFGFVTCVQLGLACIQEILSIGGHLELLISLHDDRSVQKSGRIYLDEIASNNSIPLAKVDHINDENAIHAIRSADLDWLFIIGWSQIAGPRVLASPKRGVIGMHPTLLPRGRGRAAIPWAIIKGLSETGVSMFVLDEGVDTGPIIDQVVLSLAHDETAGSLYSRVADAHCSLIRHVWPALDSGSVTMTPQEEGLATVWPARHPADGEIRSQMTVSEVDRLVRATTRPYPGAFWQAKDGKSFRIWKGAPNKSHPPILMIPVSDGIYYATEFSIEG